MWKTSLAAKRYPASGPAPLPLNSILFDTQSAPRLSSPIVIASPNKRGHDYTGLRLCLPRHFALGRAFDVRINPVCLFSRTARLRRGSKSRDSPSEKIPEALPEGGPWSAAAGALEQRLAGRKHSRRRQ